VSTFEIISNLAYGVGLNALLLAAALGLLARVLPSHRCQDISSPLDEAERLIAFLVVLSACIVCVVTLAGSLGLASNKAAMLSLAAALALFTMTTLAGGGGFGAVIKSGGNVVRASDRIVRLALQEKALRVGIACVGAPWVFLFVERLLAPPVAWDALTYHLLFPLHWIQEGRLDTLVQPTGDPSTPFYPLVGEMHFYWGFLSTGSDWWCAWAQGPFWVASSLAVACIARLVGARRVPAAIAGLFWGSVPVVIRQSVEPMVDLMQAAFCLAAVFLLLRCVVIGGSWRYLIAAAALGLTIGTKYTGLVWVLPLVPLALAATLRCRERGMRLMPLLTFSIAVAGLLGGYAYVRNTLVAGNPVFPLGLTFDGRSILQGPRTLGQYHHDGSRQILIGMFLSPRAILDLGAGLTPYVFGAALVLVFSMRRLQGCVSAALVSSASIIGFSLFLMVIPYHDPRLAMISVALAVAASAVLVPRGLASRRWEGFLVLLPAVSAPFGLFYWAKDFARAGLNTRDLVAVSVAALLLLALPWNRFRRVRAGEYRAETSRLQPSRVWAAGLLALILTVPVTKAYESRRFAEWKAFWSTRYPWGSTEPLAYLADAARVWSLIADLTRRDPATVAYSGTNIPYPLTGIGLRNRVRFVPRNGHLESWHYDWSTPVPDPFSRPSTNAWAANVRRSGARYLCLFREVSADDSLQRFPVEIDWAEGQKLFRPLAAWKWARIYEVLPARPLGAS
jgi:hypothetical protein